MITKNANGTYTVGDIVTVLSEEAALALLEDGATYVDPLTQTAFEGPRHTWEWRIVTDGNVPAYAEVYQNVRSG